MNKAWLNQCKILHRKACAIAITLFYLSCSSPSLFSVAAPANCKGFCFVVFFWGPLSIWCPGSRECSCLEHPSLWCCNCSTVPQESCSGGAKQQFGLYWCLLSSMLTLNNDVATVLMLHARPNEWERNIFIILKCQIDFTSSWHYLYILLSPPPPSFFFF